MTDAGDFTPTHSPERKARPNRLFHNQKRAGNPITPKERARGDNVVDLVASQRERQGGGEPTRQEGAQGGCRSEVNADADRRQEAC